MSEQPKERKNGDTPPPSPSKDADGGTFTIRKSHVWIALRIAGAIVAIAFGWHILSSSFFKDSSEHHMSNTDIGATVKESMQQQLSTDSSFSQYHLQVQSVEVVNKSGNQYEGMAVVRSTNGIDHNVMIEVTVDGDRVLWQSPPGSFAFAALEQLDTVAPTLGENPKTAG